MPEKENFDNEDFEKINGTYAGGQRQSEKCKSVVEYGTKNPTD